MLQDELQDGGFVVVVTVVEPVGQGGHLMVAQGMEEGEGREVLTVDDGIQLMQVHHL